MLCSLQIQEPWGQGRSLGVDLVFGRSQNSSKGL